MTDTDSIGQTPSSLERYLVSAKVVRTWCLSCCVPVCRATITMVMCVYMVVKVVIVVVDKILR